MRSSRTEGRFPGARGRAGWARIRGLTLAEVLVAILLLAAGLAMTANVLVQSNRTSARSRDLTAATLVARTQLDRMMEVSFPELISPTFERSGKIKQGPVTFRWQGELEELGQGLVRIRLIVSWQSREGINQRQFSGIRRK